MCEQVILFSEPLMALAHIIVACTRGFASRHDYLFASIIVPLSFCLYLSLNVALFTTIIPFYYLSLRHHAAIDCLHYFRRLEPRLCCRFGSCCNPGGHWNSI